MSTLASTSLRFRSKTITAALAFFFGSLGAHRFYLYGTRDIYGWAHLLGTLIGIPGAMLVVASERASMLGWVLAFFGAVSLLSAFLAAIVYGLHLAFEVSLEQPANPAQKPLRLGRHFHRDLFAADRRVPADDGARDLVPDLLRKPGAGRQSAVAMT
jgi:hypothetical protein